ncbi:MAG: outer membrane beta-barrel protein [Acidobacteriota bacterium]
MSIAPKILSVALAAVTLSVAGWAAPAQASTEWELTPTVGYRFGGEFESDFFDFFSDFELEDSESYGLTIERAITRDLRIEFLWSHQDTQLIEDRFFVFDPPTELFDLEVDIYHVGVVYQWNVGQVRPFVVGSVGATRFSPEPSDLSTETFFSASIGGGAKFMITDNFGIRAEGRLFNTFLDDGEDFYCRRDCRSDEDYVYQAEARLGLIFAF